ncbi:cyclic-di-AMP receptor [Xylocopilactobacillus apicola]|uniref:Protein from nitrogen regulatory protein P-II (GLNB) family n=1 Tax=Xylocopilactobacillus apicola TaxID=2932184 RepID=A0AAU9DS13_9LACO|nr:cyclic-di-AMP receptor [Xylocopilactobacillus apicola]BDR58774.1 hypothetical protein XA3_12150 [Xylocopilactobacillus apicola]
MKLVIAIIQDQDANELSNAFVEANVRATKISSNGGFLKSGNTTFMVGIEDERKDEVLEIIKTACKSRSQFMTAPFSSPRTIEDGFQEPVKIQVGGATVFVIPIEETYHF